IWTDQDKWLVGVSRGKQTEGTGPSAVTIGDRIVVFTPTFAARDKSFWQLPPHGLTQDMEEAWMSDPLPGHILDVRIGDPKNQGENGILVLTSENSGKDRHLYFFTPVRT
ncbi:MAG TPA: hypothetical protein VGS41_02945, partial [Chthonomonadales bacterium]|nr:hypothetical protein [Chthonomonadales bacterium]